MKTNQSKDDGPLHQTVADGFEFKSGGKAISVGFTEQKLSAHAGSATFWAWLHSVRWGEALERRLPHRESTSNNHLRPLEKALGFMHGVLCDARKLTHIAYFRRDPLVPELLGIRRMASQSSLSRFFSGFATAGANLSCFRPLWSWCLQRLPSRKEGYTIDLDSTKLLHSGEQQEGVQTAFTRLGKKPCLHPLLAIVSEVRLVAQLWLRPGNASCGNNATAFFLDLWHHFPRHLRIRGVRADSGFCLPELLALWEQLQIPYVVVTRLTQPIQYLLRSDMTWATTTLAGTEVSEIQYQGKGWEQPRRLILVRHRLAERPEAAGKTLLEVPGYVFQTLFTSLPSSKSPLEVWSYYNGRADCENVIKELQYGFALPTLCLRRFWATEAALSLATLTYNLTVLFQRHLGWQTKVTIHSLRFWLFVNPGLIAHPAGKTTIKIAVPHRERRWWSCLWEKILCPLPNCNAVENRPAFAG